MAKTENRIVITFACTECSERVYTSSKNKRNDTRRLEIKKYCPRCRTHRLFKETK